MKHQFIPRLSRLVVGALAGLSFGMSLAPVYAQSSDASVEDMKPLVVMIDATLQGGPSKGAGIICGVGSDSLYIATANHVVRKGQDEAQDIQLQFKWLPGTVVKGQLLRQRDTELDLAVLRVKGLGQLKFNVENFPFDRLGASKQLRRGDEIYLLGYPNGKAWRINTTPEKFAEARGHSLEFESNWIAGGHSGGALLDRNRNVVGMLRSDYPPYGEAINILSVIQRLSDWGYPVNLGFPTIPRKFSKVEVGYGRVCALSALGAAYCFGDIETFSPDLQVSQVFSAHPVRVRGGLTFSSISGRHHRCGVTTSGDVYCWGYYVDGTDSSYPVLVSGGLKFRSVSAGYEGTYGITTDNEVYNLYGEKPSRVGGELAFRSVSVTFRVTREFGITLKGELYRLPLVEGRQPIGGNLKLNQFNGSCGLTNDGAAYYVSTLNDGKDDTLVRMPHPRGLPFISVGGGGLCCGVDTRGDIYCQETVKGSDGKWNEEIRQVPAAGGLKFSSVSTYKELRCALTEAGEMYCWGTLYKWAGGEMKYGDVPVLLPANSYLQSLRDIRLYRLEGDFNRALGEAEAALKAYPNERAVRQMRAVVLSDLGRTDQALAEMRALLGGEKDRETHLDIAQIYRRAHNYPEMEKSIQSAERLSKTAEEQQAISFRRAAAYNLLRRYEQAEAEYRKILQADPENATALNNLGYMLAERNVRLQEAYDLISRALKAEPQDSSLLDSMGFVCDRLGKLDEAETYLRRAWETSGPNPLTAEHLADIYFKKGKVQEALALWREALQASEGGAPIDIDPAQVARLRKKLESRP